MDMRTVLYSHKHISFVPKLYGLITLQVRCGKINIRAQQ